LKISPAETDELIEAHINKRSKKADEKKAKDLMNTEKGAKNKKKKYVDYSVQTRCCILGGS
jgi:hypothetical protein